MSIIDQYDLPEADEVMVLAIVPHQQVDPKLSKRKDDDGRLPIHWAASANQLDIVQLLAEQKGFDVDIQVRLMSRES